MAYTLPQRRDHIREIQEMLYELSFFDERIPKVIPDGIYGRETALAVKAFQQLYGLRATGEVNQATWEAISDVYRREIQKIAMALDIFPHERKNISAGDQGLEVYAVQAMLRVLADIFQNLSRLPVTGLYDSKTENAVREFQKISGQPETGVTDPHTWNLLASSARHGM